MIFLKKVERGIKALANELKKPDSFIKGEEFEDYVRSYLFPKSSYDLINRTHGYNFNCEDFVESSLKPDFRFRDKGNREEFYVEAKWRSGTYNRENKIEWCSIQQLRRYKAIDKNERKVFIALGFGDNPAKPGHVAIFPIGSCNYPALYRSFIDKYSFFKDKPVFSSYLWNLK